MTDLRKAAEMALEALEWNYGTDLCDIENCMAWLDKMNATIQTLRQALAQPEQEPVAWQDPQYKTLIEPHKAHPDWIPLYTAPPNRKWVGLTQEEVDALLWKLSLGAVDEDIRTIEAKLKEKNT